MQIDSFSSYPVFDGHACYYENEVEGIQIKRKNVIFDDVEEYKAKKDKVEGVDSISLIFDIWGNKDYVMQEINSNVSAVKIHNRDQLIDDEKFEEVLNALTLVRHDIPIIYDAFYYGFELQYQPSLKHVVQLAVKFPERKIIVAHSGGHKVLDYFLHLRLLKNIYYDLSFSTQYLYDSSAFLDFVKLIKYTDKSKLLFGSDFSWASLRKQLKILTEVAESLALEEPVVRAILFENSAKLYVSLNDLKNDRHLVQ
jgi:hypothetical protein